MVGIATAWNILPCHRAVDCGRNVGFISALKREAFSLILRKYDLTPFDVLHAGPVTTGDGCVLSTEQGYDAVRLTRSPPERESFE